MTALFARFRAIYLNRWDDQFATPELLQSAMREWGEALFGFDPSEIRRGLSRSRHECEWPPSIAKFVELARDNGGVGSAAHRPAQLLPKPVPNPIIAKKAFSEMRKAVGYGV